MTTSPLPTLRAKIFFSLRPFSFRPLIRWALMFALTPLLALAATLLILGAPTARPAAAQSQSLDPDFAAFLEGVRAEALTRGVRPTTIERAFAEIRVSDRALELENQQPEFLRQPWSYLDSAVNDQRIARGKALLARHAALFDAIEARWPVPRTLIAAFWGVESDFGVGMGNFRVVDALATLAWRGRRPAFFRNELFEAFKMLDAGDVAPERLRGSWAGAMGQTQFTPQIFNRYALDYDQDGRRDIWTSTPDALASTARYVLDLGWRPGQSWGEEVTVPAGFDWLRTDLNEKRSLAEWRAAGVRPVGGGALTGDGDAVVVAPGGARGPIFLLRDNFRVILKYNYSVSYALAVALLSERYQDRGRLVASWPRDEQPLSRADQLEMQQRLAALGFDPGPIDGVVGAAVRAALRRYQLAEGVTPDGFPSQSLLRRLRGE